MVSKKLNFNDHSLSELDFLWNKIKKKLSINSEFDLRAEQHLIH